MNPKYEKLENIKNNLILRHKVTMLARNYLANLGFIEVETPILCKSTPEGAFAKTGENESSKLTIRNIRIKCFFIILFEFLKFSF